MWSARGPRRLFGVRHRCVRRPSADASRGCRSGCSREGRSSRVDRVSEDHAGRKPVRSARVHGSNNPRGHRDAPPSMPAPQVDSNRLAADRVEWRRHSHHSGVARPCRPVFPGPRPQRLLRQRLPSPPMSRSARRSPATSPPIAAFRSTSWAFSGITRSSTRRRRRSAGSLRPPRRRPLRLDRPPAREGA